MSSRTLLCALFLATLPAMADCAVLDSLVPYLVNHYTFDNPLGDDPLSRVELDLGSDATNIQLVNGAPRIADGAWWGSRYALETGQRNTGPNDDWKAGIMFPSSAASTLVGTNHVIGISIMGWFKPLGDASNNPSPNTNTPNPNDHFTAFGLAGFLRGDEDVGELDGHAVRALLEVINGKVTGLGRRLDSQVGSGQRASVDDWYEVMPPGTWTHLAATFDFNRSRILLYKNGQLLEMSGNSTSSWDNSPDTDYTSSTNAGGIKIGGSYPDDSAERNPFNGRIDELMFFNKTLTAQEIADQFRLVSNIDGDFNLDGKVDAADYVVWRDNLGGGFAPVDYAVWKANFGTVAPSSGAAAVSTSTVPEPAGISLVILAGMLQIGGVFLPCRTRRGSLAPRPRAS